MARAQYQGGDPMSGVEEDDVGTTTNGDIFSDFNEDIESTQVLEDERFYRYGRFFAVNMMLGITDFGGNRGIAYKNEPPTYGISAVYFSSFQVAFELGVEYSKHNFMVPNETQGFRIAPGVGLVSVNMVRPFFGMRYYLDTSDLGTALTYASPHLIARFDYWYQTNKFIDHPEVANDSGGGIGGALGFGLEFPIEIRSQYIGLRFLAHQVNFFDKFTQKYRPLNEEGQGFDDFSGMGYSSMVSYVINW